MMKCTLQYACPWLLACTFHLFFTTGARAQSCRASSHQSLHELRLSLQQPAPVAFLPKLPPRSPAVPSALFPKDDQTVLPANRVFLPRWSAEELPFFCKIEHNWAKNRGRIPIKFRLGSVEYVDWLEGKGIDR